MTFSDIERIIVDFFEANGADVDNQDGEFILDGLSVTDNDVSLTALASAVHTAVTSALLGDEK